jgi:hypothetical protein
MYRVWTKNWDESRSILTDWQTKAQCRRYIVGRWGHWPPFACISKAKNLDSFLRYN